MCKIDIPTCSYIFVKIENFRDWDKISSDKKIIIQYFL